MQSGFKSEFITRLYNNDLDCIVLVADKVLRGKNGLFLSICTTDRRVALGFLECINFTLNALIREFTVNKNTEDNCYVVVSPLSSMLVY